MNKHTLKQIMHTYMGHSVHSAKKIEKIKNDDLDLFYVYFSSIMSHKYLFIEKNCPKLTKKN